MRYLIIVIISIIYGIMSLASIYILVFADNYSEFFTTLSVAILISAMTIYPILCAIVLFFCKFLDARQVSNIDK